jgi:hypothetical protein
VAGICECGNEHLFFINGEALDWLKTLTFQEGLSSMELD